MTLSRRGLLSAMIAASASLGLMACTTTKDGTTTKKTLNVAKINSYAKAGLNAAATIASALAFVPALEGYASKARDISIAIQKDLTSFTEATGSQVEIVYDDANWKTIVDSILTNLTNLLDIVKTILSSGLADQIGATDDIVKKINLVSDALNTIVSIFTTITAGFLSTAGSGAPTLSEADALAALGVQ